MRRAANGRGSRCSSTEDIPRVCSSIFRTALYKMYMPPAPYNIHARYASMQGSLKNRSARDFLCSCRRLPLYCTKQVRPRARCRAVSQALSVHRRLYFLRCSDTGALFTTATRSRHFKANSKSKLDYSVSTRSS